MDTAAVGLEERVRSLEASRPQSPSALRSHNLGPAAASGEILQVAAAILGIEHI